MKLRSMALVAFGVLALGGAGCKKKPKEGTNLPPDPTAASGGSGGSGGSAAEPAKEAKLEGKALADKYMECTTHINGAKWDDFRSKCIAKDFKIHPVDGPDVPSADASIEWFKSQRAGFPDMKVQPQLVLVSGRNILSVALITGTHTGTLKGPMGELPATNKKIGQLMFHRLAINDENRATEEWSYFDPATMASQLGLMPMPMRPAMDKGMDGAPVIVVAADDAKEKANIEAFQKSTAGMNSKKAADYMPLYNDDAVESDQAGDKDHKGKKDIQASSEMFLKAFPDIKLETPTVFAAGDYVVGIGTFSGTHNGPLGPIKPTKKAVTGQFAEVIKMKDSKISELWRFRNGMAMARQLGLMPEPKPAGAGSGSAAAPAGGGSGSAAAPKGDAPKGDAPKAGSGDTKKSG